MIQFPSFLERLILGYIKETFLKKKGKSSRSSNSFTPPPKALVRGFNDKDLKYFSTGAARLSTAFTKERGVLPLNYLNDPVLRSGYLLYFLPVNFLKIVKILNELSADEIPGGKIRILDLGSGPGTSMLGMMSFFSEALRQGIIKDAWCDFTLVDQNYSILKDARHFHRAYRTYLIDKQPGFQSDCSIKNYDIRRGNLGRFLRNFKYHFIIVSNVLNEFGDVKGRADLICELMENHLEPEKGKLILIEPALKRSSRDLQRLRDEVLKKNLGFVYSPCLHGETCPLNVVNERDWCHFYLPWQAPKFIERVGKLIGTNKEWLAMSYMIFGKQERKCGKLFKKPQATWRVISNRMRSKGKKEVVLCGPRGRYHLTKLDKDTSKANYSFDSIQRGDLIEADVTSPIKYQVDGNYRVDQKDLIRILSKI